MNITSLEINGNKLNTGKSVLVESYTDPDTHQWYRVYSDGWCEQGGLVYTKAVSTSNGETITFLKAFKDTSYTFTMGSSNTQTNGDVQVTVKYGNAYYGCYKDSEKTETSIKVTLRGSWKAEGYINLEE